MCAARLADAGELTVRLQTRVGVQTRRRTRLLPPVYWRGGMTYCWTTSVSSAALATCSMCSTRVSKACCHLRTRSSRISCAVSAGCLRNSTCACLVIAPPSGGTSRAFANSPSQPYCVEVRRLAACARTVLEAWRRFARHAAAVADFPRLPSPKRRRWQCQQCRVDVSGRRGASCRCGARPHCWLRTDSIRQRRGRSSRGCCESCCSWRW